MLSASIIWSWSPLGRYTEFNCMVASRNMGLILLLFLHTCSAIISPISSYVFPVCSTACVNRLEPEQRYMDRRERMLYQYMVYLIDQAHPVKMAGNWWSSRFCELMDRDKVRLINSQKKWYQYPGILTEQAWSIEDLIYGFWGTFSCGIQREVPSRQDCSILTACTANHSMWFGSSGLLTGIPI